MIDVKDCIGKRVIMRGVNSDWRDYYEINIVKLSPNEKYVKIRFNDGREEWKPISGFGGKFWEYEIVDILEENIPF